MLINRCCQPIGKSAAALRASVAGFSLGHRLMAYLEQAQASLPIESAEKPVE